MVDNRYIKVIDLKSDTELHIVVVGAGAAGLSASWLLSKRHRVSLVELEPRLGGHAHSAFVSQDSSNRDLTIDTGFIVYNELNYPNLVAWFKAMGIETQDSDMSFAVSREGGGFEYAGGPKLGMFAQPSLVFRLRFWRMLKDLLRFYKQAANQIPVDSTQSLGAYLKEKRYSDAFVNDHLMPFGAAIWSTSRNNMLDYPAAAFIRFCDNHGLLKLSGRPQWRTVTGGSHHYVNAAKKHIEKNGGTVHLDAGVIDIDRQEQGVSITLANGEVIDADHVVIATHADTALTVLKKPSALENSLLGAFDYDKNQAVLHCDNSLMPKRKKAWCSWNYVEQDNDDMAQVSVSYWMNRLQNLNTQRDYFVSLNPSVAPKADTVIRSSEYEHPIFNANTWQAQQELWSLQGINRTWFCGAYFGAGFHEDAVQAGFAVAEQLGGIERPWTLENRSGRIVVPNETLSEDIAA